MTTLLRVAIATVTAAMICTPAVADIASDPTFDTDGFAVVDFAPNLDSARDVAVQTGDQVVLVGLSRQTVAPNTFDHAAIARLDANGALDPTFGDLGTLALLPGGTPLNFGGADARAVAVGPVDQKIVVVGNWNVNDGAGVKIFVLRLTTDGDPDPEFAGGNAVLLDLPGLFDPRAESVALQSDGGVIVGGGANNASVQKGFVLRVKDDGTLDSDFATNGVFAIDSPAGAGLPLTFHGLVVLDDDTIIAAGGPSDLVVLRLTSGGQPDSAFDDDGVAHFNMGNVDIGGGIFVDTNEEAYGLAVQADGSIVVAGMTQPDPISPTNVPVAARITASGGLDTGFGVEGFVFLSGLTSQAALYDVVARPDGDLVVAGLSVLPTQLSANGKTTSTLSDPYAAQAINGLVALADGRVVGGGEQNVAGADYQFVAMRLDATALTEPECPPLGELSGDCEITATDALIGLNMAVGIVAEDPAADVDCNGAVAASDALKILRVAVGIDQPPAACA